MIGFILGEKGEQSQTFDKNGKRIPVTFIRTATCYVLGLRHMNLKLGFGQVKNIKKPVSGELNKAGIKTPLRFLREFRLPPNVKGAFNDKKKEITLNDIKIQVGQELKPTQFFKPGDLVDVSGVTKGKGFSGVVKRHKFAGGPKTHGQSDRERAPGSIGQTTTPGRVYKGKRMAGRMGGNRVTIKKLEIIDVKDEGLIVKGLVPGAKKGLLEVKL